MNKTISITMHIDDNGFNFDMRAERRVRDTTYNPALLGCEGRTNRTTVEATTLRLADGTNVRTTTEVSEVEHVTQNGIAQLDKCTTETAHFAGMVFNAEVIARLPSVNLLLRGK